MQVTMRGRGNARVGREGYISKILGGLRGGLTVGEKTMILDGGRLEMVVNSCLEDLEERMRSKRMWKLDPQVER